MERYYITLSKPKRNIIHAPYCNNILNHDTNEIIVKLVTLIVIHNKIIKIMRVMHVHIKTLLNKTLYHQCGEYCITFMYIYTNDFTLVHSLQQKRGILRSKYLCKQQRNQIPKTRSSKQEFVVNF